MRHLATVLGVVLGIAIGYGTAACSSSPLTPAESAALNAEARACLEAAVLARLDAGAADGKQ